MSVKDGNLLPGGVVVSLLFLRGLIMFGTAVAMILIQGQYLNGS